MIAGTRKFWEIQKRNLLPDLTHIVHSLQQPQFLLALPAVSYMGVGKSGFFLGEVVLYSGEEVGPGRASGDHRPPVGTRRFNSSKKQHRVTELLRGTNRGVRSVVSPTY